MRATALLQSAPLPGGSTDERGAGIEKAQEPPRPGACVVHPDAGALGDVPRWHWYAFGDEEGRGVERMRVEAQSKPQRSGEPPRAIGALAVEADGWLEGPDEHRGTRPGDHIDAQMHSIDEKEVGVARGSEHHLGSASASL